MARSTVFFLHALGSSAGEWDHVISRLSASFDCVALDMPGFGSRADEGYADVDALVHWLAGEVRRRKPAAWIAVGHSMGGKIVTLLAALARDGAPGLSGLAGVVLLAASPPSPEPMDEGRRAEMLGWFNPGPASEAEAETFVDANTASPLPPDLKARAIADVRRSSPDAWRGWLEQGSREDWSGTAGLIPFPVLIVAGGEDGDLGEFAQRRLNRPHYDDARVEVIQGAAHLLPYERPEAVARLIAKHAEQVCGQNVSHP